MPKKVAVVLAPGCEEIEALTPVDILRRLGVQCDMVGLFDLKVEGGHQIMLTADKTLDDSLLDYDLVAFPGGLKGAQNLRDSAKLKALMVERARQGKWNAAMCAAPIAFARYGLLDGTQYTMYPGMNADIEAEVNAGHFKEDIVVIDHQKHILTSRGPATAMAYGYAMAQILGIDTKDLEKGMLYEFLMAQK